MWIGFDRNALDYIGMLPEIFDERDARPAAAQANDRYSHGGGWNPLAGWTLADPDSDDLLTSASIVYPGDPPLRPMAACKLPISNEMIFVYECAWVMVLQADDSFEISRMD